MSQLKLIVLSHDADKLEERQSDLILLAHAQRMLFVMEKGI